MIVDEHEMAATSCLQVVSRVKRDCQETCDDFVRVQSVHYGALIRALLLHSAKTTDHWRFSVETDEAKEDVEWCGPPVVSWI